MLRDVYIYDQPTVSVCILYKSTESVRTIWQYTRERKQTAKAKGPHILFIVYYVYNNMNAHDEKYRPVYVILGDDLAAEGCFGGDDIFHCVVPSKCSVVFGCRNGACVYI